jgi:hypothetical protein
MSVPEDNTEGYIERAARSVTELQSNVNNMADVMVFLEVLGYNDDEARKAGLVGLRELAQRVFERIDYYDEGTRDGEDLPEAQMVPVPSAKKRVIESLSFATPWLGALALLYVFGVSLWLAWGLPTAPVTALMVGVFLGLLISEGPMQAYTRIFMFYHAQGNVSECARALRRSYVAIGILLVASLAVILGSSYVLDIPWELAALAVVGATTISVHRIGFLPIYALKKTKQVLLSYGLALPLLVAVFELTKGTFPDPMVRYLVALMSALGVLSVFAWHNSRTALDIKPAVAAGKDAPPFYKPIFVNVHTINSNFVVQFWETLPYYLSATFFFVLVFGDRVLSWIGNPVKVVGGVYLPMVFNSVYHSGADMALAVLFPVAVVQYVMLSSVHEEINNLSLRLPVTQSAEVDRFIRRRHALSLVATMVAAAASAVFVLLVAPGVIFRFGGAQESVNILYVATAANLMLSLFVVNSSFMALLNAPKAQAVITMAGAATICTLGVMVLPLGFGDLVYAYLVACALVAATSAVYVRGLLRTPSSRFFARFT